MKAKLKFKGEEIEIPDVIKAEGMKKYFGLMFKKPSKARALLFEFDKQTKQAIHSLFCPDFLAIWLDENNKIINYKLIFPNKLKIKPEKEFMKLLEIPLNNRYSSVVKFFLAEKDLNSLSS